MKKYLIIGAIIVVIIIVFGVVKSKASALKPGTSGNLSADHVKVQAEIDRILTANDGGWPEQRQKWIDAKIPRSSIDRQYGLKDVIWRGGCQWSVGHPVESYMNFTYNGIDALTVDDSKKAGSSGGGIFGKILGIAGGAAGTALLPGLGTALGASLGEAAGDSIG